jgi:hypothetical protein
VRVVAVASYLIVEQPPSHHLRKQIVRQYLSGTGLMPLASPHDILKFCFAPGQNDRGYAKDEALTPR